MKVIIIEDELPAIEKLERYISKYDAHFEIIARLSSISESVSWLRQPENEFDIAFMDIQLTDGLSFDIFNHVSINKPVIFVTAFDEFAIDAFKANGIDYLLKPITFTDVSKALSKFKNLTTQFSPSTLSLAAEAFTKPKNKDRFLVRLGNHLHAINTIDVALFYAEGRTVFLLTNQGKKFILDYKLEDLEQVLSTKHFFRVNRTFIVSFSTITDVVLYSNSRLKINPKVKVNKDIIISRERVNAFKNWFEGN